MTRFFPISAIGVVCVLLLTQSAFAQPASVRLTGRVTDPQQAAVDGAAISARNLATGTDWTATSGGDGRYALPMLPPGTYDVEVRVDGFSIFRAERLTLAVGQDHELNVPPVLRSVRETVVGIGRASSSES